MALLALSSAVVVARMTYLRFGLIHALSGRHEPISRNMAIDWH